MRTYYPVALDLAGKDVLVVGGGRVAEGKIDHLLEAGALIRLVSPIVTPRIVALAAQGALSHQERAFRPEDVEGAWIVVAAADDRQVNREVAAAARAAGRLVNAVDDIPHCDWIAMSIVRKGELQIAASTGGGSPAMARWIREELERVIPDSFGVLLELLAEIRGDLKERAEIPPYEAWRQAITVEVLDRIERGDRLGATMLLRQRLEGGIPPGIVYLIGAGPGEARYLTQRAAAIIRRADTVFHDRLIDPGILDLAHRSARIVDVGKEPGAAPSAQEEINTWMIAAARRGETVARLKGGDPFVFGRGGEEALALHDADVGFEVVPGISAAIGAPALAGIPVTFRGVSSSFHVVSGHGAGDDRAIEASLDAYRRSGGTLVVLMGLGRLPWVIQRLRMAGVSDDLPAAIVEAAGRSEQVTVEGTVGSIVDASRAIAAPATLVVGEVVRLRDRIAWHAERRLKEAAWS